MVPAGPAGGHLEGSLARTRARASPVARSVEAAVWRKRLSSQGILDDVRLERQWRARKSQITAFDSASHRACRDATACNITPLCTSSGSTDGGSTPPAGGS